MISKIATIVLLGAVFTMMVPALPAYAANDSYVIDIDTGIVVLDITVNDPCNATADCDVIEVNGAGSPPFTTTGGKALTEIANGFMEIDTTGVLEGSDSFTYKSRDIGTNTVSNLFTVTITFNDPNSGSSALTATTTLEGVCAVNIATTNINFGSLTDGQESAEVNAVTVTNVGGVPSTISHSATDFLDGTSTAQIAVADMRYDTASGTYASKSPMSATPISLGVVTATPLDIWYQLTPTILTPFFTGSVTSDLTVSFLCS